MIELSANPEEVDEEKIIAEQQIMEERYTLISLVTYCVSLNMIGQSAETKKVLLSQEGSMIFFRTSIFITLNIGSILNYYLPNVGTY